MSAQAYLSAILVFVAFVFGLFFMYKQPNQRGPSKEEITRNRALQDATMNEKRQQNILQHKLQQDLSEIDDLRNEQARRDEELYKLQVETLEANIQRNKDVSEDCKGSGLDTWKNILSLGHHARKRGCI